MMSVLAVMVNCALMGMSDLADRLFPGYNSQPLCLEIHHKYKNKQSRFLVLYTRIEYC